MALHLIKLCVGAESIASLSEWQTRRFGAGPAVMTTRQTPRRAAEITPGGSLYWVIRGLVACRQPILAIETTGDGVARQCRVLLDIAIIPTEPAPRRAFQGWRYLAPDDAPPDLPGLAEAGVPPPLARALREIGAW